MVVTKQILITNNSMYKQKYCQQLLLLALVSLQMSHDDYVR